MKNKKIIIGIGVGLIILVGGFLVKMQMDGQAQQNQEKTMEKIAKTYYEDYLYEVLTIGMDETKLAEFLSIYEKDGFKTSISNIEKVSEIDTTKDVKRLNKSCNKEKNNITITPKAPYGKQDYKLKVVCE